METLKNQRVKGTLTRQGSTEPDVTVFQLNCDLTEAYFRRLDQVLAEVPLAEFARRAQMSESALRNYSTHRSLPGWENAVRIARAAGKSLDWFTGDDAVPTHLLDFASAIDSTGFAAEEARRSYEARRQADRLQEFVLLPLFDVRAAAGHGAWNDQERISKTLAFRRDWIASNFQTSPEHLALIYVDGDSMAPRLSDGDVVMVDRSSREVRRDGMYVFTLDGALLIKHLQRLPGDRLRAMSENPLFPPFELNADQLDPAHSPNSIVGSVVWGGIRL